MIFTILHSLSFSKDQATCLSDLFSALCFPMGTFTAKSLQENQKLKDWRFQVHRKITCCFHNAVISATVSENPKQALCFPSCFVAPFSRLRAWKHFWCLILMLSVYFTQLRDLNTVKLAWIGIFKPHQHWLFSKFQTDSVEPTRAHRLMHLYFLAHMQIHQCVFVWYIEQLCSTDMQIRMQSQRDHFEGVTHITFRDPQQSGVEFPLTSVYLSRWAPEGATEVTQRPETAVVMWTGPPSFQHK